jgi:hypothetical protein
VAPVLVHERLRRNGRGQASAHAEVAQAQASATERVRGAGQQRAAAGGSGSSARLLDELSARHQELLRYVPWGGEMVDLVGAGWRGCAVIGAGDLCVHGRW